MIINRHDCSAVHDDTVQLVSIQGPFSIAFTCIRLYLVVSTYPLAASDCTAVKSEMTCKHCGLSDNSPSVFVDIDSLNVTSSDDLWAAVQTIDTEMAHIETLLNELVLKRAMLKRKINYQSSALLRLPSDITSEIFKAYLNKDGGPEGRVPWHGELNSRGVLLSPLRFGSVCHAWRDLAWSTPQMWNSVVVVLRTPFPNYANLLTEWLSRSEIGRAHV